MEFKTFKAAIAKQFERMSKHELFRTGAEKDALWTGYLAAFPAGTNPMFRERTEHDCNCCKSFIRTVGNVVAIIDGAVVSIWDCEVADAAYQTVANHLSALVKAQPIANAFLHFEATAGTDKTLIDTLDGVTSFTHFFVNLPSKYVMAGVDIGTALGKKRANFDVMKRGIETITDDAVNTVLELIAQNALYRGEEHGPAVQNFAKLKARARQHADINTFVWANLTPQGMIRNTAIGTLLVDLSEGVDLDKAVGSFEAKVAPQNYKRPTALVTKAMIEQAKVAINELGLGSALERRYATIEDITVNNVLFANRSAKQTMSADVFDVLASKVAVKPQSLDKVEDVGIEVFLRDILPRAESIELMFENRHAANLVSLVAPVDATAKRMFKWDNGFSWSYSGDVADSIKERVKLAGGNVSGDLCCRLAWDYTDDLDFHMQEPGGGHIYFGTRNMKSGCGGSLDVDANGGSGMMAKPVENIFYASKSSMKEGVYKLAVNNFSRRSVGVGFQVEIEFGGQTFLMAYDKVLRTQETIQVASIAYSKSKGFEIVESLPHSATTREVWGVTTQTFQPVSVIMNSPNHWDEQGVGNRHWFFMLEACRNEGTARGFYNEFLTEELTAHRKVIEMVGAKMRSDESERQLSGLGFSSTQRNNVLCRVKGSFSRIINLVF
jgi:hypothetical protein